MEDNNIKQFDYEIGGRKFNISLIYHISQIEIKIERDNLCYKSNYNLNDLRKKNNIFNSIENTVKCYLFILEEFKKNKYSLIENNNEIILSIQPHKYLKPINFIMLNDNYYDDNFNNLYEEYMTKKEELYELKYENIKLKKLKKLKKKKSTFSESKQISFQIGKDIKINKNKRNFLKKLIKKLNKNNLLETSSKIFNELNQKNYCDFMIVLEIIIKKMKNNDEYINLNINLINTINHIIKEKTNNSLLNHIIKKKEFYLKFINYKEFKSLENMSDFYLGNSKFLITLLDQEKIINEKVCLILEYLNRQIMIKSDSNEYNILILSFILISKFILNYNYIFHAYSDINKFKYLRMQFKILIKDFFKNKMLKNNNEQVYEYIKEFKELNHSKSNMKYKLEIINNPSNEEQKLICDLNDFILFFQKGNNIKDYNWEIVNKYYNEENGKKSKINSLFNNYIYSLIIVVNGQNLKISLIYLSNILPIFLGLLKEIEKMKIKKSALQYLKSDESKFNIFYSDIIANLIIILVNEKFLDYNFLKDFDLDKYKSKMFFEILKKIYLNDKRLTLEFLQSIQVVKDNKNEFLNVFKRYLIHGFQI